MTEVDSLLFDSLFAHGICATASVRSTPDNSSVWEEQELDQERGTVA
jgi:hypothetical protein